MEVDQSQSIFIKVTFINERTHFIAYKMKAALTDLLHKAISISNSKNELYGGIINNDVNVLMYSLPTKLLMNSSKLFGDSIRGNVQQETILDILTYALYIYRMVSGVDYSDLHPMLQTIYSIVEQRHYEYNSAKLVYDRLLTSDVASIIHVKAIRIKNLLGNLDKINKNIDSELVKSDIN